MFYKSALLGMQLFYFNWYCAYTGTTLFDSLFVFSFSFLLAVPSLVVVGFLDEPLSSAVLSRFPALHIDGQRARRISRAAPFYLAEALV